MPTSTADQAHRVPITTLGRFLDKAMFSLQIVFASVAATFITAWTYGPFREWLIRKKVVADKSDVTSDVVAVTVFLVLALLVTLQKHITSLDERITLLIPQFDDIIERGIGAIYPFLCTSIQDAANEGERRLEVVGLTLYTAWPHIRDWIQNDEMRKWHIILYCIDPQYMETNQAEYPVQWIHHAQTQIEDITMYSQATAFKATGVALEIRKYRNFPAVHGFRLGSGEIYFSTVQWDHESGKLTDPHNFYERVRPTDRSRRANLHRALFDNWTKKASETAKK